MATATILDADQQRASEFAERWARTIACGALAGSHLELEGIDRPYLRFSVHTEPGRTSLGDLIANRDLIATAFDVTIPQVQLRSGLDSAPSRHPLTVPFRRRLTVVLNDPLAKALQVVDPRGAHGVVRLGPYLDGDGEAPWRLHTEGVTHSGVIVGGPGSGTTALTELLAVSARATLPTALVHLDGDHGLSCPTLHAYADRAGAVDDTLTVLALLEALAHHRVLEAREQRATSLPVTAERPLVLVIIEKAEDVFGYKERPFRDITERWTRLIQVGRKTGIAVAGVSGSAAVASFGGSMALRALLMHGNAIGLRTPAIRLPLLPGSQVTLDELPAAWGAGLCLADDTTYGREFRARYLAEGQAEQLFDAHPGPDIDFTEHGPYL